MDHGIVAILEELRDMRAEMRADRRQADEERRLFQEERRQLEAERRQADDEWREERRNADARFEQAFKDVRTVGLAIVKTLNRHTVILERIDRKLGVRGNGRGGNGRRA